MVSDGIECSPYGFKQRLSGPGFGLPQGVLYLGEGSFDEPTTVRLYTLASLSGHTIIASLQFDPLHVGMVSAG
jgi:hypothetical protein